MKSRIRSRWHRPNENPLENKGSPTATAPVGEIDSVDPTSLTDDLSNYKPSENSRNNHSRNDNCGDRRQGQRGGRRPREDNRRPRPNRDKSEGRTHRDEKPSEKGESSKPQNRKNYKPRRKQGASRKNDHSSKQRSDNSRHSKNKPGEQRKSSAKQPTKATGLKGFLGKIFGS